MQQQDNHEYPFLYQRKILTSRLSLSKHLAHNLGNLLLLGKIGVFHNRRNESSRLLLLISKHLILCIFFFFFKQKTAYEIGLGIPAEPLFRSRQKLKFLPLRRYNLTLNLL